MKRLLLSVAILLRLPNSAALATLYVAASAFLGTFSPRTTTRCALAWFFAAATAYLINDIVDVDVDIINRPERPLPNGSVTIRLAAVLGVALSLLTIILTISVWPIEAPWPIAGLIGGLVYSTLIRYRHALAANLLTATLVATVPLSAASRPTLSLLLVAIALFAMTAAREMKKDVLDQLGDQGRRPPPFIVSVGEVGSFVYCGLIAVAIFALLLDTILMRSVAFLTIAMPLSTAILLELITIREAALQSRLLKLAAYALVPVLLVVSAKN